MKSHRAHEYGTAYNLLSYILTFLTPAPAAVGADILQRQRKCLCACVSLSPARACVCVCVSLSACVPKGIKPHEKWQGNLVIEER